MVKQGLGRIVWGQTVLTITKDMIYHILKHISGEEDGYCKVNLFLLHAIQVEIKLYIS